METEDAHYNNEADTNGRILQFQLVLVISVNFFFLLPCLSLIKLKKYNYGKWSQLLNKVIYFI